MIEVDDEVFVSRDVGRMRECLERTVEAVKRGRDAEAVFYLQQAFTGDTATQEFIENAWRRK